MNKIYKLNQNIKVSPKAEGNERKYCGLKGERVFLVKKECGLCIVKNIDSKLSYWVEESQLDEVEFKGYGYCYYCGAELTDKELQWIKDNLSCCSGFDCGCMGLPTEPPICFKCNVQPD